MGRVVLEVVEGKVQFSLVLLWEPLTFAFSSAIRILNGGDKMQG